MTSLGRRLTAVETALASRAPKAVTDDEILAAFARKTFEASHLSALFTIIEQPFRASVMWAATHKRRRRQRGLIVEYGPEPVLQAAALLSFETNDEVPMDLKEQLQVSFGVPELGDFHSSPDMFWYLARLGLVSRLFERHGVDRLLRDIADYIAHGDPYAPVPLLSPSASQRMLALVEPMKDFFDVPLLLWQYGSKLWTSSDMYRQDPSLGREMKR